MADRASRTRTRVHASRTTDLFGNPDGGGGNAEPLVSSDR